MAIAAPNTATTATAPDSGQSYGAPLATVTTLFFMWGFLTCLNDILVPHLKSIFDLNYTTVPADPVRIFWRVFHFLVTLRQTCRLDWLSEVDGGGSSHHGSSALSCSCQRPVFPRTRYFWGRLSFLRPESHAYRWLRILTLPYWESRKRLQAG